MAIKEIGWADAFAAMGEGYEATIIYDGMRLRDVVVLTAAQPGGAVDPNDVFEEAFREDVVDDAMAGGWHTRSAAYWRLLGRWIDHAPVLMNAEQGSQRASGTVATAAAVQT